MYLSKIIKYINNHLFFFYFYLIQLVLWHLRTPFLILCKCLIKLLNLIKLILAPQKEHLLRIAWPHHLRFFHNFLAFLFPSLYERFLCPKLEGKKKKKKKERKYCKISLSWWHFINISATCFPFCCCCCCLFVILAFFTHHATGLKS